ncbi:NAD-dependent epimerase/dehydratase family protein [Cryobacterium sp. BB736]|uniref:NAD-dependent epimerase/dehydratase family protein n=1 Tax=Cryobacterium sp. BB736 TaxID=2746963 RepID=UPI0018745AC4|nr:NAD-dependent epimerase/dehydratase family protein [Cryobacterium sp. BB736]
MTTHVLLGGNGAVGRETATQLLGLGIDVASFGRRPSETPGVRSIIGDILDRDAVTHALDGAAVAYLLVGLQYRLGVWRREWPIVMGNAIEAARINGTHLVFLDNVYSYGRTIGPMTERTPIRPTSKKGEVRAGLLRMLDDARASGVTVTVARSADFYGPGAATSVFNMMAVDNAARGKRPVWMFDATKPHSMTYTPDIGRALALIGTDERAAGGTWHMPTAAPARTGTDYVAMLAAGDVSVMGPGMMRIGGLFMSAAREVMELRYQNTESYLFDSNTFESTFGVTPTPYADGIAATLDHARRTV